MGFRFNHSCDWITEKAIDHDTSSNGEEQWFFDGALLSGNCSSNKLG